MRIKRLSALLLSALLITSPIGYMTVNGDTIDAKDYSAGTVCGFCVYRKLHTK